MEPKSTDCADKFCLRKVREENKDRASLCLETETHGAHYSLGKNTP